MAGAIAILNVTPQRVPPRTFTVFTLNKIVRRIQKVRALRLKDLAIEPGDEKHVTRETSEVTEN